MNDLQQEVARLRERCEVLEYELAATKENTHTVAATLQKQLGLTSTEAKILAALSDGALHTRGWIEDNCSLNGEVTTAWLGVYILKLRRRIAPLKIISIWGHGYQIEGDSLAAIQSIIKRDNP